MLLQPADQQLGLGQRQTLQRGSDHGAWLARQVAYDAGPYEHDGAEVPIETNMVFTVEPGLYIGSHENDAPVALRGIGIRIEDTVLVTNRGAEPLSAAAPKSRETIEAIRKNAA